MFNSNVILVGLIDSNLKKVGISLADKIGFYYLNSEEMIDYALFDKDKMEDVCGIEYMNSEILKVVKSLNNFDKSVITMTYETFSNYLSALSKKAKYIYLKITKKELNEEINKVKEKTKLLKNKTIKSDIKLNNLQILSLVFEERDKFLKKNCDFEVKYDISSISKTVKAICEAIK